MRNRIMGWMMRILGCVVSKFGFVLRLFGFRRGDEWLDGFD